jgi:hypothetical protein
MKIGDYVKYDNDTWEIIYRDEVSTNYYGLSCRTSEREDEWAYGHYLTETNLSQLHFEL